MKNKPLVSLTVICYNAEKFILEAIQGALSQTYTPLEIIFSDDASTDNTFAIIEKEVSQYDGPHSIILNKNSQNLGIGKHVSKVWFDIANGDWIIVSAGDDVSLPHRVQRLMEIANPSVGAIHHNNIPIDEFSNEIPLKKEFLPNIELFNKNSVDELIRHNEWLKGATMCLNKQMLLKYGPINPDVVNEDNVLAYRAQHFGQIIYLNERLIKYRVHKSSVTMQHNQNTPENYKLRKVKNAKEVISLVNQIIDDSKQIPISDALIKKLKRKKNTYSIDLMLYDNHNFKISYLYNFNFYKKLLKKYIIKAFRY